MTTENQENQQTHETKGTEGSHGTHGTHEASTAKSAAAKGSTAGRRPAASTKAAASSRASSGRSSSGKSGSGTRGTAGAAGTGASTDSRDAIAAAVKDAAHAVIGFAAIGWNKLQVERRDLLKELNVQVKNIEGQLDGAKGQVATAIRTLDTKVGPVRHDLEVQLDKVTERLPEPVREMMESARKIARDTEHQVRQAVGAL